MAIEKKGAFILVQKTLIKIDNLVFIKPQTLVQFDGQGREISRDFPKLIIQPSVGVPLEFIYKDDQSRDNALNEIAEIISA